MAARKRKQPDPAPEGDREALRGLWHLSPSPSGLPVVMYITDRVLRVWDISADEYTRLKLVGFDLVERDSGRLLMGRDEHDGACFSYRLAGDRLELSIGPGHQDEELNLSGTWCRIE